ncbi:MAG: Ku protein [Rhodopila sp.]|jgi:DNA end-binding protein Ku
MAQRPVWRGHLRLALVSCPVALFSAKHDRSSIKFNLINPETGNRIRMLSVDAETEKPVERRNLVKGYEFRKDTYLLLSNEDLDSVKVESSEVMNVEKFVDGGSIDPLYYDTGYYLAPDGTAGRDVYQILREAIGRTGRVALSRVVIGQRERVVALRLFDGGLAAHTLYEQRDLNDASGLFDDPVPVDEEMVKLATQLVDRQTAAYEPSDIEDRYETRLRAMLDAKLKGEGINLDAAPEAPATNVIDLMAALRKSLSETETEPVASKSGDATASKPAKSPPAKSPTPTPPAKTRKRAS